MNKNEIQGKWTEIKGKVRTKWGKLTDNDMTTIGGNFEQLVGRIQQLYGYEQDRAEREVNDFIKNVDAPPQKPKDQPKH